MTTKDSISEDYLESTKCKFLTDAMRYDRQALIIGSDNGRNIGARIANRLRKDGFATIEKNKSDLDIVNGIDPLTINHSDVLILANGYTHLDWIEDYPDQEIDRVIGDSLVGSIRAAKSFVNETINDPWKKYIIFIGSMAYISVLNGSSVYCAAKAGLAHFSKCIAWELAPKNYNVLCIHPSNTDGTPMTEETIKGLMRYRGIEREDAEKYWGASLPRKKWLQADDIGEVVSSFAGGKLDYLSGGQINLSGGQR